MNFSEALDGILNGEKWRDANSMGKCEYVAKKDDSREMNQDYLFHCPAGEWLAPWTPSQQQLFSTGWEMSHD